MQQQLAYYGKYKYFFNDTNLKVPELIPAHPNEYYLRERRTADNSSVCQHTPEAFNGEFCYVPEGGKGSCMSIWA